MNLLTHLHVDSPWSYLAAIVFPAVDVVFPVLPSEALIIALGVASAGSFDPRLALLVACAALGAFTGDNILYWLGIRFEPYVQRKFFSKGKGPDQRAWAERSLARWGIPLIILSQFIPGGKTATMLTCGLVRYNRRRFLISAAIASAIWALYSFLLGRLGGHLFENKPWIGLIASLAITVVITGSIELARRAAKLRRTPRRP